MYPLLPLSDTILLTSMPTIEHDLAASTAAVTATMSLYLLAAGVGFALWGPISGACGADPLYFKQHRLGFKIPNPRHQQLLGFTERPRLVDCHPRFLVLW